MIRVQIPQMLFLALAIVALAVSAIAEVPQLINYQGRLTDNTGEPVEDDDYLIKLKIYGSEDGNDSLWSSGVQEVSVTDGLFNYLLGSNVPLPDDIFDSPNRYLGITVGSDAEISRRTPFTSSAFTFQALKSDTTGYAKDIADLSVNQNKIADNAIHSAHIQNGSILCEDIGTNGAIAGQVMKWNGSEWEASEDEAGSNWTVTDSVLYTSNYWGIARGGADNLLLGDMFHHTHVNLGVACTTGIVAYNNQYITVGGGLGNVASGNYNTVSGGTLNWAGGTGGHSHATIGGGRENTASGGSTIGGGLSNEASGSHSVIGGGQSNEVAGGLSVIPGGFGNTITATADFSYLFGLSSTLTEDSTFMVDMPHIRFGDEADGYEFPESDGTFGQVMATDGNGQLTWQAATTGVGESGEYDGEVNSDMIEDSGANTTINFASPFTSTAKPHFYITVVLKGPANGLVEGAAIKAVEDIKGAANNWTGFDVTVSKYSDGSSISDTSPVYVTWMAIGR